MTLKPADLLSWNSDIGYGFFPVDPGSWPYDEAYRAKYEAMANTDMAKRLNFHRVSLANYAAGKAMFQQGSIPTYIDIGPGDGAFIRAMSKSQPPGTDFVFGYDVNPAMVDRLKTENRFAKPDDATWTVMTFWDSFEHIHRPDLTVAKARSVAMSIPIFRNREHVLESKHFRPDEHVWYFTEMGLRTFMAKLGFACEHSDDQETRLGREDIKSFVFVRDKTR